MLTLCLFAIAATTHAQDTITPPGALGEATEEAAAETIQPTASMFNATAARDLALLIGPGVTYPPGDSVGRGTVGAVVERNSIGTWLRLRAEGDDGTVAFDGWAWNGDLELSLDLRYSRVPVSDLPDADVTTVDDPHLADLYAPPVIGEVSEAMRAVFQRGQVAGLSANIAVKVGDSLSADATYFTIISDPNYVLGPYDYLEDTVRFYAPSGQYPTSAAARVGMTSAGALDPMWSGALCINAEPPLLCEFNLRRPSVALILFGPNDMIALDSDEFREAMRDLVETSLEQNVIPVLSTFSYNERNFRWNESVDFNHAIIDLAGEYDVPLINLWSAARPLPNYGLEGDDTHMRLSGYRNLQFDQNLDARFGGALRNLLTVRMLDEIRRTVVGEYHLFLDDVKVLTWIKREL